MSRRAPLRRWSLAAASAVTLLAVTPLAASAQFSSVTFFGDSFTDMGMADVLAAGAGIPDPTPSPPYWPGPAPLFFPGTSTDGPTWAAYFAAALGHPGNAAPALIGGNNFAISGARTGLLGTAGFPIGMLTQLGLFAGVPSIPGVVTAPRAIDPTGLYVVWGGVNDIRDAAGLPAVQRLPLVQTAVQNVAFLAQQLALGGAHELLVPFAPNSGVVPEVALDPATAAVRASLTSVFNDLLTDALGQLRLAFPTTRIATFDLDALYAAIAADAATGGTRFGITNLSVPCFLNFGTAAQIPCDVSLFSDGLHPTTRAQQLVAGVAAAAVVPEPATVTLLAAGVAVLGAAAMWRRRYA